MRRYPGCTRITLCLTLVIGARGRGEIISRDTGARHREVCRGNCEGKRDPLRDVSKPYFSLSVSFSGAGFVLCWFNHQCTWCNWFHLTTKNYSFVLLLADEQMVRSKYCQMSYKVGNRWQKGWDNSNPQSRPLLVYNTISNLEQLWLISIRHCLSSSSRATPLPDVTQHERWKGEARSITGTSLLVVLLCGYNYWGYYVVLW